MKKSRYNLSGMPGYRTTIINQSAKQIIINRGAGDKFTFKFSIECNFEDPADFKRDTIDGRKSSRDGGI